MNKGYRPITNISLLLTEDCNFECEYCFIKQNPKVMNWETAKQAVDWVIEQNKDSKNNDGSINFFGGEPTLEWDLLTRIVEYGKSKAKNLSFGMTSNGSLLTQERIDYCVENNINILFSVDGPEHVQNIHRKTRNGEGTFDQIEGAMRECVKRGLSGTGRVTYTPKTLPYLFETIKYLFEDVGFTDVAPTPAVDSFMDFTEEDYKEYDRQFDMIDQYFKDQVIAGERPNLNYYGKCIRQLSRDEKMTGPCGAAKAYAGISVDGDIYPCHRFTQWPEWKLGNVWDGITDPKKRDVFLNFDCNLSNSKCAKCDNLFCGGTCLAANYENNGTIYIPGDDACELSKRQFNRAKDLVRDLKGNQNFRNMFSQYVQNDRAGVFEVDDKSKIYGNQDQKVYLDFDDQKEKKEKCDCESGECNSDKKKPSLTLLNNRINTLEYQLKQANQKLDDIGKVVTALSNVVMDSIERG